MTQPAHLRSLDGIRGVAALMVMIFHLSQAMGRDFDAWFGRFNKLTLFGQTGVGLFFVLSGFLITRILLASRNTDNFFKPFYIRRSLRIFPLYYAFLFFWCFVLPLMDPRHTVSQAQTWWFWLYLQNIAITFGWNVGEPGHFWSLAVEEHFYLIWPLAVRMLNLEWLKRVAWIGIGLALVSRAWLVSCGHSAFYFTISNADGLLIGGLLAMHEDLIRTSKTMGRAFVGAVVVLAPVVLLLWSMLSGEHLAVVQICKGTLIVGLYGACLGVLLSDSACPYWLRAWLSWGPLTLCGRISYGLYVYHPVCYYYTVRLAPNRWGVGNAVIAVVSAFIVAHLSYQCLEKPFLRLKTRFHY